MFSTGMLLFNIFTLLIVSLPYEASGGWVAESPAFLNPYHPSVVSRPPPTFILTTLINFNYCQQINNSFALVRWFLPFPSQLPLFPNVIPAVEHNSKELPISLLPCTFMCWITFIQGPFHCISVKESFWCKKQQHINERLRSCIN